MCPRRKVEKQSKARWAGRKVPLETVARWMRLLEDETVDPAAVAEEIRAHSDLESLVMKLSASLVLSPEGSIAGAEEAAILLGTERLKVVVYMWLLRQQPGGVAELFGRDESKLAEAGEERNSWDESSPEELYLASFLRCLGLDPSRGGRELPACFAPALEHREFAELRNMLMRDFVALIPILNPSLLKPRTNAVRDV